MSLRVWLPLNGDLRNLGCSGDIQVTNNGATVDNNGKIGKCYLCNSSTYFAFPSKSWMSMRPENNLSFFYWVKGTTTGWILASGGWEMRFCPSYMQISLSGNGQYPARYNNTFDNSIWYHIGFTWCGQKGELKLYLNGKQVAISSVPSTANFNVNSIIKFTYDGPRYINDVRIYDHALSAAEVAEIARGLVLHYKLDNPYIEGATNLAPNPYANSYSAYSPAWDTTKHPNAISVIGWNAGYNSGVSSPSTGYHAMWNLIDNIPTVVFQNHNSEVNLSGRWLGVSSISLSYNFTAGTKYTLSWEQKSIDTLGGYTTGGRYYKTTSSGGNNFHDGCPKIGQNTKLNKWEQFSYTFTVSNTVDGTGTNGTIYIYGMYGTESTMLVRNIQLETKDHATPYTPNSRAAIDYIPDSSGYGYNGTINGTLTVSTNTSRYSSCIYMPKTTTITHPRPVYGGTDQEWTCCMWVKLDTTNQSGQQMNNFNSGNNIIHGANGNPLLYLNAGANDYYNYGNLAVSAGVWTHIAFVFKNSNATKLIYINGENHTNTSGPNRTSTPSGVQDIVTVGYNLAGYIADYRIYCTSLLDTDIKSLYNLGMKIDNLSTLHTYELEETNTDKLMKIGILKSQGFNENDVPTKLIKDKGFSSIQFIEA